MRINLSLFNNTNIYKPKTAFGVQKRVFLAQPKDTFELSSNPISFKAACAESNFKIKEIKDLRCPVCDRIMLNAREREKFATLIASKTGEDLVKAFDEYGDEEFYTKDRPEYAPDESEEEKRLEGSPRSIYRPIQQEIVDTIKELALDHPTKSLNELVEIKSRKCLGELIVQQMDVVRELEGYLESVDLPQSERESVNYIIQIYKNQILGKNEIRFKRLSFIHDLKNIVENDEIQEKIIEIISKLPNSANSVDSFFVKWGGTNSSREIALNLIYDTRPTAEHILPRSVKGSKNDTSNYLCDCAFCNSSRGDMPFEDWAKTIPDFQEKLQRYLARIARYVDDGRLDCSYDGYVDTMIRVLDKRSNGFIKLSVPVLENTSSQKQLEKKKQRALEEAKQTNIELGIHISELKMQIEELEAYPYSNEINTIDALTENYNELEAKISDLREELQAKEADMAYIIKLKRKINQLSATLAKTPKDPACSNYQDKEAELQKLKAELEFKNEFWVAGQIDSLETEIYISENRLEDLKQSINEMIDASRETFIDSRMLVLAPIMEQSKEILLQLSSLRGQIKREPELIAQLEKMRAENAQLEQEDDRITQSLDTAAVKSEKYNEFIHLNELLEEADSIREQKRNRKNKNLMEIIDIAYQTIIARADELSEDPEVKYFINLETILENKKAMDKIGKELHTIAELKKKADELEIALQAVNGESGYDKNSSEFQDYLKEKTTIAKVKELPAMKSRVASLITTYKYNEATLRQLETNPKIPVAKFFEYVNRIRSTDMLKQRKATL